MNLKIKHLPVWTVMAAWLLTAFPATARNDADTTARQRPVVSAYRLEAGSKSAYASYLSPFSYRGTNYAFSGLWTKVLPCNPQHLSMQFEGRVNYGSYLNPAKTARELDLHVSVQWGLMWQQRFAGNWLAGAGGTAGIYGGALYLPRNGNNPVSPQAAIGIGANLFASKHFCIKRLPVLVADRLTIPLMSGFFSQDYGESFYEIYLGNHSGLAHFGHPGNRFGIDNLFSVTLDFGRAALEVGYRFSTQTEKACNLTTRMWNNAFVIGIIPGGIGLKNNKKAIYPLY